MFCRLKRSLAVSYLVHQPCNDLLKQCKFFLRRVGFRQERHFYLRVNFLSSEEKVSGNDLLRPMTSGGGIKYRIQRKLERADGLAP